MENLQLRNLEATDEAAFLAGLKEAEGEDPHWYSFVWKLGMTFPEMLTLLNKERRGIELAPGRVPHSMLYGFLENEIIGRVSVRHELNDHLRLRGGHMGYWVAKKFRRKGLAKEMVRQALQYCKDLGLEKILITCGDENEASWRVIEHFQGKLENKVWDDQDKEVIRRYWITLN